MAKRYGTIPKENIEELECVERLLHKKVIYYDANSHSPTHELVVEALKEAIEGAKDQKLAKQFISDTYPLTARISMNATICPQCGRADCGIMR
jgi:hypothetical protein